MSLGRFLSVSALLALGVFVLIGLNVTGPNMRKTAQIEYAKSNLADAKFLQQFLYQMKRKDTLMI